MNFLSTIGLAKERSYLIENLAMLTNSGMSIIAALNSISSDLRTKRLRRVVNGVIKTIEGGSAFWRALAAYPALFPEHTISLIRIGEESGKLSDNLKIVARQEGKEREFKSKIRSAMMYPVFVLAVTLIVGVGIAWFILPRLAVVFSQLDIKLPLITRLLIAFGEFLGLYGYIAVPIFGVIMSFGFYLIFIASKTKHIGQNILFVLPGTGSLMVEAELSRFGYLLGTLLQAGLSINSALDSISKATTFRRYGQLFEHLRSRVEMGQSLHSSFNEFKGSRRLVPATIQQMIAAGEQSGALSDTLLKIGENFENKMEITMKNLSVILEPVLLVIVWAGVVGVALAVIFPIYSLIGQLNP